MYGVLCSTATKTETWLCIWLAKCMEWEINPSQDPSMTHTTSYLAAFAHKVHRGEITQIVKQCRIGYVGAD